MCIRLYAILTRPSKMGPGRTMPRNTNDWPHRRSIGDRRCACRVCGRNGGDKRGIARTDRPLRRPLPAAPTSASTSVRKHVDHDYGFVRAEAFYDFDRQGDTSNLAGLDTATRDRWTFNTSLRVSRLGFRVASDTDIGPVGGQLEFDLFGSGGTAELRAPCPSLSGCQFWRTCRSASSHHGGLQGRDHLRPPATTSSSFGEVDYSVSIEEAAGSRGIRS